MKSLFKYLLVALFCTGPFLNAQVGTIPSQTYIYNATDANGLSDLQTLYLLVTNHAPATNSPTEVLTNTCYLKLNYAANTIQLAGDNGSFGTAYTVGSTNTVSNSQCSVDVSAIAIANATPNTSVTVTYTFLSPFAGTLSAQFQTIQTTPFSIGTSTAGNTFSGWNMGGIEVATVTQSPSVQNANATGGRGGATIPATALLLKGNGSVNGVIPAVPGVDFQVPLTAPIIDTLNQSPSPITLEAFGHSIVYGTGSTGTCNGGGANSCGWAYQVAFAKNWAINDQAVPSSVIADQMVPILAQTITPATYSLLEIGTNEGSLAGAHLGDASWTQYYRSVLAAEIWTSIASSTPSGNNQKVNAQSSTVIKSGTWTAVSEYGGAMGLKSTTIGDTLTVSLPGTALYIVPLVRDTSTCTIDVNIDGNDTGQFTLSKIYDAGVNNYTYVAEAIRVKANITTTVNGQMQHTVIVTDSAPGATGCEILFFAGSGGNFNSQGPYSYLATEIHNTTQNYYLFNNLNRAHKQVVFELATDGLPTSLMDLAGFLDFSVNPALFGTPANHPNNAGHLVMANAALSRMNNFTTPAEQASVITTDPEYTSATITDGVTSTSLTPNTAILGGYLSMPYTQQIFWYNSSGIRALGICPNPSLNGFYASLSNTSCNNSGTWTAAGFFNNNNTAAITDNGIYLSNNRWYNFSSTTAYNGSVDVALGRSAAGVMEVDNGGTLGSLRDLKMRTLNFGQAIANSGNPTAVFTGSGCTTGFNTPVGSNVQGSIASTTAAGACTLSLTLNTTNFTGGYPTAAFCSALQNSTQNTVAAMDAASLSATVVKFKPITVIAGDVLIYSGCGGQ